MEVADTLEGVDTGSGSERPSPSSQKTDIVPEDVFLNRQPDLSSFVPQQPSLAKRDRPDSLHSFVSEPDLKQAKFGSGSPELTGLPASPTAKDFDIFEPRLISWTDKHKIKDVFKEPRLSEPEDEIQDGREAARLLHAIGSFSLGPPELGSPVLQVLEPSLHSQEDTTMNTVQATQEASQRPKKQTALTDDDLSDVICLLHPHTQAAYEAIKATMLAAPQHIFPNDDLDDITEEDFDLKRELSFQQYPRQIALRISSSVKKPEAGFTFGRNRSLSDILLIQDEHVKVISNTHFKIFVNGQGSLMIEDLSTNGIAVDDQHLRYKDVRGHINKTPATRALQNGAIVFVVGRDKAEVKFMIRIPNRGDQEAQYEKNLRHYLAARGTVAQFASMRESAFGNQWNGGKEYNFTGHLGNGAFATVYKVQTQDKGAVFAAKELDKRRFYKNGVLDINFGNELKIMKLLDHPHIVRYQDYKEHENWIYIIMEYVPYGELAKELKDCGHLPEPVVQIIARQMLHALNYLHRRNITHRDIKPDNILIASRDPLIVKLSDFGLSKCVEEETFLKTFCGTLLYCAPEVYPDYSTYERGAMLKRRRVGEPSARSSPYNESVDMWSFGAVLYHLLCGKAPIMARGDDRGAQMLNNIMTKDVDFRPLRALGVSSDAIDFIDQLLNRNPRLRPKEAKCFQHPWIVGIKDEIDITEHDEVPEYFSQKLRALEEVPEDALDEDAADAMKAILGFDPERPYPTLALSPPRPVKRSRITRDREARLPAIIPAAQMPDANVPAPRLFGEITPSLIRSSGVFGQNSPFTEDMPALGDQVQHISVNDFVTMDTDISSDPGESVSERPLQYPRTLEMPTVQGSAPSLLGAEAQIGQLQMASPDAGVSEAATPDTTNPHTPGDREQSPASAHAPLPQDEATTNKLMPPPKFQRRIDMNLLANDAAFNASLEAREAARSQRASSAATFHVMPVGGTRSIPAELARTIDARTGDEVRVSPVTHSLGEVPNQISARVAATRMIRLSPASPHGKTTASAHAKGTVGGKPLGRLTTVPGSIKDIDIILESRLTSWGRGVGNTVQYNDKKDTRIPKYALKITFWAPGLERHVEQGGDWMQLPNICTLIATSTTLKIWVNDVELYAESSEKDAALYGKLYHGDIITIFKSPEADGPLLQFRVEITFGESATTRPDAEKGFQVLQEKQHHQRVMKERESMRASSKENTTLAATTAGSWSE